MSRKKYYYCIDYRNMNTAIHGLIVFRTRNEAEKAFKDLSMYLKDLEKSYLNGNFEDSLSYDFTYQDIIWGILERATEHISEIDFRKIVEKQLYNRLQKVYNDDFIIVNFLSIDLYV